MVLSGGGARGAYQAGVLRGIADILGSDANRAPFQVFTGISAGAINATVAAVGGAAFGDATERLWQLWCHLHMENVCRTHFGSVSVFGLHLGGGLDNPQPGMHLLDATPLRAFLRDQVDSDAIRGHIRDGVLRGVAVTTTSYASGYATTFFDAAADVQPWTRSARVGERTRLELQHVLASAAIPILFPPVPLDTCFHADGAVRMTAPLSPAIHLGAERVLAIGVRHQGLGGQPPELNQADAMRPVTLADIVATMFNGAFSDNLDADAERMTRINHTVTLLDNNGQATGVSGLRDVPLLIIRPSRDLGRLATDQMANLPRMLRALLSGLGTSGEAGGELLSYLSFDPAYTIPLLELGRADALAQRASIEAFLAA